ncbi:MAG: hypothetical protein QOK39_2102 [Acidimicrobiaceae bacterium]|nr:hypothetical protein [Acidimicrobiaceae bacterium]
MADPALVICPACGTTSRAGARFCSNCAAPLAPGLAAAPGGPAPRKATTSAWVKALIVTLMVAVVAAVTVAIVLAVGVGKATDSVNALTPKPGRPAGYHGPSFPGMLTQDHVAAGVGSPVALGGETLTAGTLAHTSSIFGPTLCSPVTVANDSPTAKDAGPAEWRLQQPNGIIETFALTGTLPGGQIAPGGKTAGTVCFADTGQSGTFLLLWQPLFQVMRAVWLLPG